MWWFAAVTMKFKIDEVIDGTTLRGPVDSIFFGVCVAMILLSFGCGLLGLSIDGPESTPRPVEDGVLPYDDPAQNARQRRLTLRARLNRAGVFMLGLALLLLGPVMLIDGLDDPSPGIQRRPKNGGSVGGGLVMAFIGFVLLFYCIVAMKPGAATKSRAKVPVPTPPHPEHTFSD
jgi:hypothetical protein